MKAEICGTRLYHKYKYCNVTSEIQNRRNMTGVSVIRQHFVRICIHSNLHSYNNGTTIELFVFLLGRNKATCTGNVQSGPTYSHYHKTVLTVLLGNDMQSSRSVLMFQRDVRIIQLRFFLQCNIFPLFSITISSRYPVNCYKQLVIA